MSMAPHLENQGSADSNQAEYLAIRDTLLIFFSSKWGITHGLWLKSGNLNAISWVLSPLSTLWRLKKYVAGSVELIEIAVALATAWVIWLANLY
ncbi:hypothetical protein REPUB_Repub03eG0274800 [Reevesia pubescens]